MYNSVISTFRYTELKVGDIIGFGIAGEWESEYMPAKDSQFYSTKNGQEVCVYFKSRPLPNVLYTMY